ncbi:MAG: T9SS type A sorting domain-containing protein [Bacteroidota bacterium]|nr:T9SS type A sorting domain-containing protein [Bacteroidota bacterium]
MKLFTSLILILVLEVILYSQENTDGGEQIHRVPFLSSGNVIELSVQNISEQSLSGIKINVIDAPSWMNFKSKQKTIDAIASNGENSAEFSFSVDKSAVVNKEESVSFTISTPSGEVWTKQVKIVVTPPERFELYQNYPNPFNPSTVISWQSPPTAVGASWVTLKVFDVLGREVVTLVDEMKEAGYHQVEIDARLNGVDGQGTNYSSGIYFYQITAKDERSKTTTARKKMMFLK